MMDSELTPTFKVFQQIVESRRSARAFLPNPIPASVLEACFDAAIRAPSSHNLETWKFIEVQDPKIRASLNYFCLNQTQVLQAPTLVIVVAQPDQWRQGCNQVLKRLEQDAESSDIDDNYRAWIPRLLKKYRYYVPLLFDEGPLRLVAPVKALLFWFIGIFKPMYRGHFGKAEREIWAIKTAALACENFMLALTAAGYDSCPIEGFDEIRVKKLLSLPHTARVVMVIAAGRQGSNATIPQIRFDRSHYIQTI
jgi:nitroreductase